MSKNIIKEDSIGLQAGGDITVNKTVNELPKTIHDMFVELLHPSIEQIGEDLKNEISGDVSKSIGEKVKNVLKDGFIKSIKDQIRSENLNYHIKVVLNKIQLDNAKRQESCEPGRAVKDQDGSGESQKKESVYETIKKTDLFLEWVEGAENVSKEDDIISEIWQDWLYRLSCGEEISDSKMLLEKMKVLTVEDAKLLLRLKGGGTLLLNSIKSPDEKYKYLIQRLSGLDLIKRNYGNEFIFMIFSFIIILVVSVLPVVDFVKNSCYVIAVIMPLFIYFFVPSYKLTWLGGRIVGKANI